MTEERKEKIMEGFKESTIGSLLIDSKDYALKHPFVTSLVLIPSVMFYGLLLK